MKPVVYLVLFASLVCLLPPAQAEDAAPAPAAPPLPEWIWLAKESRDNEIVMFRKSFEVTGKIKSAFLIVAADNHVAVFFNGKNYLQHDTWETPLREEVTSQINTGKNVLVARGTNDGGAAGLLAELAIELEDGTKQIIVSDGSWKAAKDPAENWREPEYDDSTWTAAVSLGKWGIEPWGRVPLDGARAALATQIEEITVPDGFRVELLYSVPKAVQGSWVSLTSIPGGRFIVSDQYGGLYRITPAADPAATKVEPLDLPIGDAQGLLWAYDSLYVTVNGGAAQGSGLYRIQDTDGDGELDQVKLLKRVEGGGEHGPHGLRLGPDGKIYLIAGNHTHIPSEISPTSPHRNYAEDLLLPRNPDGNGHATGVMAPGGWIVRTDENGETWDLFCAGFRNPYDIDFNADGELFTFDADMEWDTGTPWYRPTRVNHCVSAAEFGWRFGTGKWPAYYADSVGAVVDIGLGSPTGIEFGTGAKFPAKYQQALFINDWTYGKIYAVHMQPRGAGYTGSFETFIQGKPLPVTDIVVHEDGALYFTIGGRKTQSGLYRVTYVGPEATDSVGPIENAAAASARELRRSLEAFHGRPDPAAIDAAWPSLGSYDRVLRYAARVAIEHQDPALWLDRARQETRLNAQLQLLLAQTRTGDATQQADVLTRLNALPFGRLTEEQYLDALRIYGLAFLRLGGKQPETLPAVVATLRPLFPSESEAINRELFALLVYLDADGIVAEGMAQLSKATTQQEQLYYVFILRNAKHGWLPAQRETFFGWMNLAQAKYRGGASFPKFIQRIREDAVANLSEEEQVALREILEGKQSEELVSLETTRQFIHNWQIEDVSPLLAQVGAGRSFERGRQAYEAAQCIKCHRFKGEGASTGPDITGVGGRFDPLYLLESLVVPSKAISDQYVTSIIETNNGLTVTGRVIEENKERVMLRTDPFARELTEIKKADIADRVVSPTSEMPAGLVNVLTPEEILDLIAYLRSAGDPNDKAFAKP